jgi:hypothetical protein
MHVLPWCVGTGKTAMLGPIAEIYRRRGYQTIYCVPFGPVRDQSAALLYRCGIPFAYVVPEATTAAAEAGDDVPPPALADGSPVPRFELQPSFMCANTAPVVYIVDPEFLQYYVCY